MDEHPSPWSEVSSRWHQDYERGRPSYPRQVVEVPGVPASATVLEVASGTGKLTRLLVSEYTQVIAVEPDPDMRRWFTPLCPQAPLIGGKAEQLPLADASVDGIFVAEAFHWFAHEQALAEFARVLRPHGALVLMWNRPAGHVEPAITEVDRLLEPHWPDDIERPLDLDPMRFPHARDWPRAFEHSVFGPLQESRLANAHVLDPDGLVAYFGSMGWIDALPDDERAALLDQVRSHLAAGTYRLPFETHVHWTRLSSARGG